MRRFKIEHHKSHDCSCSWEEVIEDDNGTHCLVAEAEAMMKKKDEEWFEKYKERGKKITALVAVVGYNEILRSMNRYFLEEHKTLREQIATLRFEIADLNVAQEQSEEFAEKNLAKKDEEITRLKGGLERITIEKVRTYLTPIKPEDQLRNISQIILLSGPKAEK